MNTFVDLDNKRITPQEIAEIAIEDADILQELLKGVMPQTQKSARRENCSQALMYMAETWPEILLPHWDHFINLFDCDNGSSKYVAVYAIASLTQASPGQFERYFDNYFSLLDDPSVMVASHAAFNAAKIAFALPALQERVTRRLMEIDQGTQEPGRKALVKAYVIEALGKLYPTYPLRAEILDFVKAQLTCPSAKAQKLAKEFIKKWAP
jgi:hypothetical protein